MSETLYELTKRTEPVVAQAVLVSRTLHEWMEQQYECEMNELDLCPDLRWWKRWSRP